MASDVIISELLDLIKPTDKIVWFGCRPVVDADILDPTKGTNFRFSPDLHGKYDVVWLYENDLFDGPDWPLVLDETIRLLPDAGLLILRYRESKYGTVFALKQQLGRSIVFKSHLVNQWVLPDGSIVSAIKISRLNLHESHNKSWTIGILSNGSKPANVTALIKSVSEQAGLLSIEYIIAGPVIDGLENFSVRYVCESMVDNLPRISEKKNEIINAAKNANIALFHDRYVVNKGFFDGFERYGYDFEYVTVRQVYETGEEYPSYTGFLLRRYQWQVPYYIKNYNALMDGAYLNGGLIILKKHLARKIEFNNLLLHNEAEDVELGWQLRLNGILPRINPLSSATTIGVTPIYTESFQLYKSSRFVHKVSFIITNLFLRVWRHIPRRIKLKIINGKIYRYAKRYFYS